MSSGVQFGIATVHDLPRVVAMKFAMFADAGRATLLPPESATAILADYKRLYRDELARHFIATIANDIVACVGAFVKTDLPFCYFDPPRYGFIGDVYTEPAYRGRGFAKKLSQDALQWFRGEGIKMVRLLASEAGRPIYEKLGFKTSDEMVLTYAM